MSVTFRAADVEDPGLPSLEPCLCTQMHEDFVEWVRHGASDPDTMRAAADARCYVCKGSGVEGVTLPTMPELNVSNANAEALFQALGLKAPNQYYQGEASLAELRRGVMRARARRRLPEPARPDWLGGLGGGARFISPPTDQESLQARLERFAAFVEKLAGLGVKRIRWD